ncbi:hypothetical protein Bbelb_124520 [Branchiostoma belcheri]|nr:hypothetical protein Bbelb_124520 [Branchiostoma belcheri]
MTDEKTEAQGLTGNCDVEEEVLLVVIGEEELCVKKATLTRESGYFSAMMSSGMRESCENKVELHGVSPEVFKTILDFFGTRRMRFDKVGPEEILETAVFLQMDGVMNYMRRAMKIETCVRCLRVAEKHYLADLEKAAYMFMRKNYLTLLQSIEYNGLTEHERDQLVALRYEPQEFICAVGSYNDARLDNLETPRSLYVFDHFEQKWGPICPFPPSLCTHGCSVAIVHNLLFILGGFTSSNQRELQKEAFCYDPLYNTWAPFPHPRVLRAHCGLAGIDAANVLYAVGGCTIHKKTNSDEHDLVDLCSVEQYSFRTGRWRDAPRLPRPMLNANLTACRGAVYTNIAVPGGEVIYRLIPGSPCWEEISPIPKVRFVFNMTSFRQNIYLICGFLREFESDPLCFNTETGKWSYLFRPPLAKRSYVDDLTVLDDKYGYKLYLVSQNSTQWCDLGTREWQYTGLPGYPGSGFTRVRTLHLPITHLVHLRY